MFVKSKGKTYIVNTPSGDDGIGPGCPFGIAWMQDELRQWYSVQLTGTVGGLSFLVAPIPMSNWAVGFYANDFGFQLLQADDGNIYQVSVDSSGPTIVISQMPAQFQSFKPFLYLQSFTDGAYYYISAINDSGVITLPLNGPSGASYRMTEDGRIRITENGAFRIV